LLYTPFLVDEWLDFHRWLCHLNGGMEDGAIWVVYGYGAVCIHTMPSGLISFVHRVYGAGIDAETANLAEALDYKLQNGRRLRSI
jgi:hypothetical protein